MSYRQKPESDVHKMVRWYRAAYFARREAEMHEAYIERLFDRLTPEQRADYEARVRAFDKKQQKPALSPLEREEVPDAKAG